MISNPVLSVNLGSFNSEQYKYSLLLLCSEPIALGLLPLAIPVLSILMVSGNICYTSRQPLAKMNQINRPLLGKYKRAILVNVFQWFNKGDHLITIGQRRILERMNIELVYHCYYPGRDCKYDPIDKNDPELVRKSVGISSPVSVGGISSPVSVGGISSPCLCRGISSPVSVDKDRNGGLWEISDSIKPQLSLGKVLFCCVDNKTLFSKLSMVPKWSVP